MARALVAALAAILASIPGCSQSPADPDLPAVADGDATWWANWTHSRAGPVALVVDAWSDQPADCTVAWDLAGPADGELFFAMGFKEPKSRQARGLQEWGFGYGAPGTHASVGAQPVQVLPPLGTLLWTSGGQQMLSLEAGDSFTFVAALHSLHPPTDGENTLSVTCTDGDFRLFAGQEMHALLPAGGEASASSGANSAGTGSFEATTTEHVVVIAQTIPTSAMPAGFVDIDIGTPQNATAVRFEGLPTAGPRRALRAGRCRSVVVRAPVRVLSCSWTSSSWNPVASWGGV